MFNDAFSTCELTKKGANGRLSKNPRVRNKVLSASKQEVALAAFGEAVTNADGKIVTILGYGSRELTDPLMYIVFDEDAQTEVLIDPATTTEAKPVANRPLLTLVVNNP